MWNPLVGSTLLLTADLNSSHFRAAAFVAQYIPYTNNSQASNNKITMISDPFYSWIPQYVLGKSHIYKSYDNKQPVTTQKVLLVIDWGFIHAMSANDTQAERLQNLYDRTNPILLIAENFPKYNLDMYPYTNLAEHPIEQRVEVRINY